MRGLATHCTPTNAGWNVYDSDKVTAFGASSVTANVGWVEQQRAQFNDQSVPS